MFDNKYVFINVSKMLATRVLLRRDGRINHVFSLFLMTR